MIDFRQDLIDKELNYLSQKMTFKKLKPSKRFISWLFRHYKIDEFTIHWYDEEIDGGRLIPNHLEFNNWIDVYGDGIDGMTQREADDLSAFYFNRVRKTHLVKKKGRLYIAYHENYIYIYWYGRDYQNYDFWWIFEKKRSKR